MKTFYQFCFEQIIFTKLASISTIERNRFSTKKVSNQNEPFSRIYILFDNNSTGVFFSYEKDIPEYYYRNADKTNGLIKNMLKTLFEDFEEWASKNNFNKRATQEQLAKEAIPRVKEDGYLASKIGFCNCKTIPQTDYGSNICVVCEKPIKY